MFGEWDQDPYGSGSVKMDNSQLVPEVPVSSLQTDHNDRSADFISHMAKVLPDYLDGMGVDIRHKQSRIHFGSIIHEGSQLRDRLTRALVNIFLDRSSVISASLEPYALMHATQLFFNFHRTLPMAEQNASCDQLLFDIAVCCWLSVRYLADVSFISDHCLLFFGKFGIDWSLLSGVSPLVLTCFDKQSIASPRQSTLPDTPLRSSISPDVVLYNNNLYDYSPVYSANVSPVAPPTSPIVKDSPEPGESVKHRKRGRESFDPSFDEPMAYLPRSASIASQSTDNQVLLDRIRRREMDILRAVDFNLNILG